MSPSEGRGPPVLGGPRAWLVWAIAVAFVVYYFSFQTGYAIVNSSVQKDLGLSIAQVGLVAAIFTWVFALCQFISGPLLDRLGARTVLLPAIALVTLGIFVFANARNFEMLLLSQALIAIGACAGFVGAGYVGGKWFGWAKYSFMFGLVQFSASLFSAFNQNLLSWLLTIFQWQALFIYVGVLGIALLVVAVMFLRDPAPIEALARARYRMGPEALDCARPRHRDRERGSVVPVAWTCSRLLRCAMDFGPAAAAQAADPDRYRHSGRVAVVAAFHPVDRPRR